MGKGNRLTIYILAAMVLGIVVGYIVHITASDTTIQSFSKNIKLLSSIFIRLVQMIIAPLVTAMGCANTLKNNSHTRTLRSEPGASKSIGDIINTPAAGRREMSAKTEIIDDTIRINMGSMIL